MKKLIFSAAFVFAAMTSFAQNERAIAEVTSQVSTDAQLRDLANQLRLNEREYIQLRDLSKAKQEQIAEINSMYSNDPDMRQKRIAAINKEFESNLAQSISPKQFTAYLQAQGRTPADAGYEAAGYGGRSLEGTVNSVIGGTTTTGAGATTETGATGTSVNGGVSGEVTTGTSTTTTVTDQAATPEDTSVKTKNKRNKSKIETSDGTLKAEDDKFKMETKKKKIKMKTE